MIYILRIEYLILLNIKICILRRKHFVLLFWTHYFYEYVIKKPNNNNEFKIIEKFNDTFDDYTITSHTEFGCLNVNIDLIKEYFEKRYHKIIQEKKGFTDCIFFDFVES